MWEKVTLFLFMNVVTSFNEGKKKDEEVISEMKKKIFDIDKDVFNIIDKEDKSTVDDNDGIVESNLLEKQIINALRRMERDANCPCVSKKKEARKPNRVFFRRRRITRPS